MPPLDCERCGAQTMRLVLHDQILICPACRLSFVDTKPATGVIRDEIPGGFVQEHFGHHPEVFYSKSAMAKRADELGLQPFVKKLEQITESAYIDPQTLKNAQILASRRSGNGSDPDVGHLDTLETSVKDWTWQ
jgi:hypothetical protein